MAAIVLACWVVIPLALLELAFYALFRLYLVPTANKPVDPQPYRDFRPGEHHTLILRTIDRLVLNIKDVQARRETIRAFFLSWFIAEHKNPQAAATSETTSATSSISSIPTTSATEWRTSTATSSTEDHGASFRQSWTIEELGRVEMDLLFAWAEFGKRRSQLTIDETEDLEQTFVGLEDRFGLYFREGSTHKYTVKRQNLDDITATHRPLLVYLLVSCVRLCATVCLRWYGFRPRRSQSGLLGWVRLSQKGGTTTTTSNSLPPLLFFHGIAPTAIAVYLPLVLNGFVAADKRRPVILFENPSISWSIFSGLRNLNQEALLEGVQEILDDAVPNNIHISIAGHSFGTCPLTWLLHCPEMRDRIKQVILLDPVAILLTSPDVMNNFLYNHVNAKLNFISTEILVQHCLRRHFPCYNSDLWLDELPIEDAQVLVCLSEKDNVINFPNVKREVERHVSERDIDIVNWPESQHGSCLFQPQKWEDIRSWMMQKQEPFTGLSKDPVCD